MTCYRYTNQAIAASQPYGGVLAPPPITLPDLPCGGKLSEEMMRKNFPKEVFEYVKSCMKRMRTRQVRYKVGDPQRGLYLDEGATYWVWDSDEGSRSVTMQSESSLHAGGGIVSHSVGKDTQVGEDTWVVESNYFLGKGYIYVHYFPPQPDGSSG